MAEREALLARTFVDLADTLVDDFDVVDFLTHLAARCVELFDLAGAGLFLAAPLRGLRLVAFSDHNSQVLDAFEVQEDDGPSLDCFRTRQAVSAEDLGAQKARWPRFVPLAIESGWTSAYALPLHLRTEVIGTLNLLRADTHPLHQDDLLAAQALADVATIGILQQRASSEQKLVADQLQHALDSRVVIEQAKGVLAEHSNVSMDSAFSVLRVYARSTNRKLSEVARDVVARSIDLDDVIAGRRAPSS